MQHAGFKITDQGHLDMWTEGLDIEMPTSIMGWPALLHEPQRPSVWYLVSGDLIYGLLTLCG